MKKIVIFLICIVLVVSGCAADNLSKKKNSELDKELEKVSNTDSSKDDAKTSDNEKSSTNISSSSESESKSPLVKKDEIGIKILKPNVVEKKPYFIISNNSKYFISHVTLKFKNKVTNKSEYVSYYDLINPKFHSYNISSGDKNLKLNDIEPISLKYSVYDNGVKEIKYDYKLGKYEIENADYRLEGWKDTCPVTINQLKTIVNKKEDGKYHKLVWRFKNNSKYTITNYSLNYFTDEENKCRFFTYYDTVLPGETSADKENYLEIKPSGKYFVNTIQYEYLDGNDKYRVTANLFDDKKTLYKVKKVK